MKKKFSLDVLFILIVFSIIFLFSSNNLKAHPAKKHKPMICVLEEDRTVEQKRTCKVALFFHRLCKLDQDCAILKLEEQKTEIEGLEDRLGGVADCGDIPFNHKSNADTTVHQKPNVDSDIVAKVKKNQKLLFIAPSEKNKNWYYVKVKKDKSCADGYIQQKFVVKKDAEDTIVKVGPKLIEINEPKWAKEGKLILVDAEGTVSISGAIQEGKIDQIIINEEEEIINGDNTFTYLLFVPNSGAEVRIVGNKNGKKVKELIFTIKVGS
tara:strand:- start:45 stop:845 length:801 start_codon:yes stop_codon:yes gene_type:complete